MTESESTELREKVVEGLEKIRPYLQADGGDIYLVDITDDFQVKVQLTGACGTCPMSYQTLKAGVEVVVKRFAPEIKSVVSVDFSSDF